jgi:phosphoribosyl-AMP cyclohydrolase / phosphoribosyl-ATP pyrophosphohydrolase
MSEDPIDTEKGTGGGLEAIDFQKASGLVPAVVQHADTGAVLMLGYMSREALDATLARQRVVFFSRSKGRLWAKGEESGHALEVKEIRIDCDRDALLVRVVPHGPTCHLGNQSCFGNDVRATFLDELEQVIDDRLAERPEESYTARLVASGLKRMAQKVSEEGLEVGLAAAAGSDDEVVEETADLIYHVLVLLRAKGLQLGQVVEKMRERNGATQKTSQGAVEPTP